MGRYDWYPQASVECISSDNKGTTLRVKCYFTNNSWNYYMYMYGYVTFNGTEYQVLPKTNIDTTGVSQYGGVVLLGYKDFYVARQTTDVQCTFSARIESVGGYADGNKSSSSDTYTVNALEQYSISYNANGGSDAPASQTKYYGIDITLSSTAPSKTGYTFLGWATSSTATSATIQPGATYSSNASVTYYAVWKINTWTVSYNTNGGSGAPANQTKTYGVNLTLSSTIPTKTGHTFKGWATSKDGSVAYQPNGTYSENAAVTLYAVWEINTWTVSYNANGGSDAPANQTKTYGVNLILSSIIPTRNLYVFKGWATSTDGSVSYEPGATYTSNANLVLYAVWELAYISPSVLIDTCYRIDSNGDLSDDGSNAQLTFTYNADRSIDDTNNISKATVYCKLKSESNWTTIKAYTPNNQTGTLTCNNFETAMGTVSPDEQYDVKVTVEDTYGKTLTNAPYISTATTYISIAFFTMDFLAGGHGIAFGKPSKNEGFECGMNSTFDGSVAVNGDVNCSNNLTVGSGTKDSIVTVNGDVNCSNNLTVGSATKDSIVTVNGDVNCSNNLTVGSGTKDSIVTVNGDVNCSNNLTVGSNTKDSIVTVNGDVNCSNNVVVEDNLNGTSPNLFNPYPFLAHSGCKSVSDDGTITLVEKKTFAASAPFSEVFPSLKVGKTYRLRAYRMSGTHQMNNIIYFTGSSSSASYGGTFAVTEAMLAGRVNLYNASYSADLETVTDLDIRFAVYADTNKTEYEPYCKRIGIRYGKSEMYMCVPGDIDSPACLYAPKSNAASVGTPLYPFDSIYANNVYVNGRQYGVNKVLWSGAWYMNASQTATLSEAVSAQPNGIVLVFSRYQDGVAQDWGFESFFVPKYVVATHAAQGSYFSSNQNGRPWSKYIYISDTTLKGNDDNTNDAEFDGRYLFSDYCVLRYVIGV